MGAVHHEERVSAMKRSRKIIVVLSNSYVNSSECQGEASLAGEYKISTWEQCILHDITFVTLNSTPLRRPTKL